MLVTTKELLLDAEKNNYAVAAINTPSHDILRAVVEAAEEEGMPVILSHSNMQEVDIPLEMIGPLMVQMAKESKIPFSVHLDHGFSEQLCYRAIRCGFTSVMADFSNCEFEENVVRTKAVTDVCHYLNITVEGEFGLMPASFKGHTVALEDVDDITKLYTDPERVNEFVDRTGIDTLVVSFGSVHGVFIEKPVMDFNRLKAVKEKLGSMPLVMHGGSGLSPEDTLKCINGGIRKINYYTYMSQEPAKRLPEYLADPNCNKYYEKVTGYARELMKEKAKYAINLFKNGKK